MFPHLRPRQARTLLLERLIVALLPPSRAMLRLPVRLPKVAENRGQKPSAAGILKIRAIARSLMDSDLASACGKTR